MSLPAEGEPRLLRSLRAAAAATAHAASLGLPAGVAALARPGSSECGGVGEGQSGEAPSRAPASPPPPSPLPSGLFSWHPLLMALAVSGGRRGRAWGRLRAPR